MGLEFLPRTIFTKNGLIAGTAFRVMNSCTIPSDLIFLSQKALKSYVDNPGNAQTKIFYNIREEQILVYI